MPLRRFVRRLPCATLLSAGALALTGCYTYVPIADGTSVPPAPVRVYLTPAGRASLGGVVGADPLSIDGRITDRTATELVLTVTGVTHVNADVQPWSGESVRIPLGEIDHVGLRQLNRSQTTLAVAGTAGAILLVRALFNRGGSSVAGVPGSGAPAGQ